MATTTKENPAKETTKKDKTKKSEKSKEDMGLGKDIANKAKKVHNKLTGKKDKKVDNATPPIVRTTEDGTEIGEGTLTSETPVTGESKPESPVTSKGILPIGEIMTPKEETKKIKYFSDVIHEIKTPIAFFINGMIAAEKGLKIHRVEENKFLLTGMEQLPNATEFTPFEFLVPDNMDEETKKTLPADWVTVFQKELDEYEKELKSEAKALSLAPKAKVGVDAPPVFTPEAPVVYATAGVDEMRSYADTFYNSLMGNIMVKMHNYKYTPKEIENNFKNQSSLYQFALKFDGKHQGWYIDMKQGHNYVRIPAEPTEFLPVK